MSQPNFGMSFWNHLEELRWRLIKSILAIIIGAVITYHYGRYCHLLVGGAIPGTGR